MSRETASCEGSVSAPRRTTVIEIGSKDGDWLSEFESEVAPTILVSPPAVPPIAEDTHGAGGPRDASARLRQKSTARWIVPVAAAILLVAPSLLVGWHALRTRANQRESLDALAPTVQSASNAAHEVTPPPAREAPPAAILHGEESGQESAVRRALRSYQDAYERLDVAAAAEVWPTVDRQALSRAFDALKSQGLHFQNCAITVTGERAAAQCRGTLQFVRKVGHPLPLTAEQEWVFSMRQLDGDWKIDQVVASQVPVVATELTRDQN